ncbi:muscarinic toxin 38 [Hippoglossus stenolepis]|uniref:muscarinic toxin 38 n=1 Tax=Hippoglossus stenolepis TaxID=195615 RepID=UPI00159C1519|nr:muscarinic toxin 38 [Hippoglossus stenolepis]
MKSVILALLVVLVVGHSEALKCNKCITSHCSRSTETCSGSDQVCIFFRFDPPGNRYFQRCSSAAECQRFMHSRIGTGFCCSSDLCN